MSTVRRTWWLVPVIAAVVVAIVSSPRDESGRRSRAPRPNDAQSTLPPPEPPELWLIAVDAAGRRLQPSITLEEGLNVIRCPGYITETYLPRDGDERPLKITLTPAATLRGRVVLGSEDHPAIGAVVEFYSWPDSHTTRTDKNGRFEFCDLNPAELFFLDVQFPGYPAPELSYRPGEQVLVVLGDGGALRGKLVDTDGAPVAGMPVLLRGHYRYNVEVEGEPFSVVSGPDGAFEFGGLHAYLEYLVVASNKTHKGEAKFPAADTATEEDDADRTCVVVVSERPRVRVRVLAPDGSPVDDARVQRADDFEFWRRFPRTAPGTYLSGPLALGALNLIVEVDGWAHRFVDVQLDRVEEHEIEVRLQDAHTLRARVVDDTGRPVAGAGVWLDAGDATTDAEGRFVARGLAAEPVDLTVEHDGHVPVSATFVPSPVEQKITMPRTGTLTGQFKPFPETREVYCKIFSAEFDAATVRVDVFGRFAVPDLPTGTRFDITFEVEGWIGVTLRGVTLEPGEVRDVGVLIPPVGATLEGVVRDNRGQALAGIRLRLESKTWDVHDQVFTDAHGVYRFSGLVSSVAELRVHDTFVIGRTFDLTLGGSQVLDIVMVRSGLLAGTAKGATELRLVPVRGGVPLEWAPEDDGAFLVNAVPGHYRIEYSLAGSWIASGLVDVVEGERTRVAVAVQRR